MLFVAKAIMELKISKLKITEDIWSVVVAEKMKKGS